MVTEWIEGYEIPAKYEWYLTHALELVHSESHYSGVDEQKTYALKDGDTAVTLSKPGDEVVHMRVSRTRKRLPDSVKGIVEGLNGVLTDCVGVPLDKVAREALLTGKCPVEYHGQNYSILKET